MLRFQFSGVFLRFLLPGGKAARGFSHLEQQVGWRYYEGYLLVLQLFYQLDRLQCQLRQVGSQNLHQYHQLNLHHCFRFQSLSCHLVIALHRTSFVKNGLKSIWNNALDSFSAKTKVPSGWLLRVVDTGTRVWFTLFYLQQRDRYCFIKVKLDWFQSYPGCQKQIQKEKASCLLLCSS